MTKANNINELLELLSEHNEEEPKKAPSPTALVDKPRNRNKKQQELLTLITQFITKHNLESGRVKVKTEYIYYLFYLYCCDINHSCKGKKLSFFRFFSRYFPSYRMGGSRYYLLKDFPIKISPEFKRLSKEINEKEERLKISKTLIELEE